MSQILKKNWTLIKNKKERKQIAAKVQTKMYQIILHSEKKSSKTGCNKHVIGWVMQ